MARSAKPRVLITGVAGGKGRLLARRLMDRYQVVGVDAQPWRGRPREVAVHQVDLRKRAFDDLLRDVRPEIVVHLALVRHFQVDAAERHHINIGGTRNLFDRCRELGVKRVVVLSSATVYGALADNGNYLKEDAPLNAALHSSEIRDLVQTDTYCTTQLWQHPRLQTVVLRPVNLVGPTVHSVICRYLAPDLGWVPTILGFDPMFQVIHEDDLVEAVVKAMETRGLRGVFNVTGPGAVPLHTVISEAGRERLPLPGPLLRALVSRLFPLGLFPFPAGSLAFIEHPCTVDGKAFRAATGFRCLRTLPETLRSVR